MKIRHYIVTYNNPHQLNEGLASMYSSMSTEQRNAVEVFVINNHSNFRLNPEFESLVTVLHNVLRPDTSTGHLARNWNQALMHGFENLTQPACDIVITTQDDTRFAPNYIDTVIELHERFDLTQFGWGDNFLSYTPHAVRMVGLWDERFCSIGYQEADYFLRALLFLKDRASINDPSHYREYNTVRKHPIQSMKSGALRGEAYNKEASLNHPYNDALFTKKWGFRANVGYNGHTIAELTPHINSYITYPYFEKDVLTLKEQRYFFYE